MISDRNQGLFSSLVIYLSVLLCGLMLFALPVYWLNSGTKLENPGVAAYDPPAGASLIRKPDRNALRFAILNNDAIIDAGQLAAISAKTKNADKLRRIVRSEPRERDARYAEKPQPRGFFFGLF
jgi:hypothetical protein